MPPQRDIGHLAVSCEVVVVGLATTWGRRCLSTPPEPLPVRPSCPSITARRILCVVCHRQSSKLGLEGTDGAIWRREEIEMLIATEMSRRTAGISECPPFLAQPICLLCLCVYAQGCVIFCRGGWRSWEGGAPPYPSPSSSPTFSWFCCRRHTHTNLSPHTRTHDTSCSVESSGCTRRTS